MMNEEKKSEIENKKLSTEATSLFQDKNLVFLATLMPDGSPQISPTWVDVDEGKNSIIINTAKGRVKQKNVTRDPRVAVAIVDRNNPYKVALIRGRVIEQTTEGADAQIDKMAKKYLGAEKYPFRNSSEKRVLLKIKPEKIFEIKPQ